MSQSEGGAAAEPPRREEWPAYYHANPNRRPRTLFVAALAKAGEGYGRQALDLGCGSGVETLVLLERGWRVLAIDERPDAIARLLEATPPTLRPLLETQAVPFHAAQWPAANFIYAGVSLPFCPPLHFAEVWSRVRSALMPGALLACHLFGPRDGWAHRQELTVQSRGEAQALCDGLTLLHFREVEEDGPSSGGAKHWHFFEVIAQEGRAVMR